MAHVYLKYQERFRISASHFLSLSLRSFGFQKNYLSEFSFTILQRVAGLSQSFLLTSAPSSIMAEEVA